MGGVNKRAIPVAAIVAFTFFLVFSPHIGYRFPLHIDEWRHITEAKHIVEGTYRFDRMSALEYPFAAFLSLIFRAVDIILFYRFLPALFACASSLALFFVMLRLTGKYPSALLAMVFFASLRSNVNVLGLWFLTPLTMAIPLIYLFFIFFQEGIDGDRKKMWWSIGLLAITFFIHPLSALFTIPIIGVCGIIKWKKIKDMMIPLISGGVITLFSGILLFRAYLWKGSMGKTLWMIGEMLIFKHGWGVLELDIGLSSIISWLLIILALVGAVLLRKRIVFIAWPAVLIILKILYELFHIGLFVPYQRLVYYLALGIIPLSAAGGYYLFREIFHISPKRWNVPLSFLCIMILIIVPFIGYGKTDEQVAVYHIIDEYDYTSLLALKEFPKGRVMARVDYSAAVLAMTPHEIFATYYFYGDRKVVEKFYQLEYCDEMEEFYKTNKVDYVIFWAEPKCPWNLAYKDKVFIYDVGDIR
ncbi:hypothetical protein J4460_03805 [Candidatus Woesearchaeota archaeon]|nr:hypothetical protein [Candidatus Woesearchaeota archaeon]HIH38293.1 hypothetical protein [Candidatus Woesearchaeota archaeon]HIH49133.1 hypothetical protein [Candidatus Woesearchaeota archaeon]HIJ04448.1 hypothetical protein [Candidatus Woesearchaeota archaeon]